MFASIQSAVILGARGHPISVEVQVGDGLPAFSIVGQPDDSIRESRDRARAAMLSSGRSWPGQRITVNLAPSRGKKSGSGLDLAIAIGVLIASGQIPTGSTDGLAFLGELGLDGSLRGVAGVAPMVGVLIDVDVVVPVASAIEAGVSAAGRVRAVASLAELIDVLSETAPWPDHQPPVSDVAPLYVADLRDVHGQPVARQALEIAAAGGHHTLLIGPPGSGKTMLATRLAGLLPDLDRTGALEATMVHSAAGMALPPTGLITRPPLRAPHHTSSAVSLVGGGSHNMRPGEISLAHRGVLFLDELAEFAPSVLDGLRQPLEEGVMRISRSEIRAILPAEFLLVAAMNPCPCGGGPPGSCECGEAQLMRYSRRVSGPLLDRFDLRVGVHRPAVDDLLASTPGEPTAVVRQRVARVRDLAVARQGCLNAALGPDALDQVGPLDASATMLLRHEMEHDRLSGRGYHRVRRLARTIADLGDIAAGAATGTVTEADVALALRLRSGLQPTRRAGWAA